MPEVRSVRVRFRGEECECVPGQLVVKLAPDALREDAAPADVLGSILGRDLPVRVLAPFGESRVGLIELDERADLAAAAARLEQDPRVEFAEPNLITRATSAPDRAPNDPMFPQQWGLLTIQAPAAWSVTRGAANVVIAILDSGLPLTTTTPPRLSHEDIDQPGRFFWGSHFLEPGRPPRDDHGHGTHVLGIAAAHGDNRRGVAGVNWVSPVFANKVFDAQGNGTAFAVLRAMQEAIAFARSRRARLVANYSGGGPTFGQTYVQIAQAARDADAVLCAAAGNDGANRVYFPAALSTRFDNVIAVSATDIQERLARFSNFGPEINVSAPGVDILSTNPDYPVTTGDPNYGARNGTSMATPFVSGVASLVLSVEPRLSAGQVRGRIESAAVDLGPAGHDPRYGFGRLNAYAALRPPEAPSPPPPPPSTQSAQLEHIYCAAVNLGWAQVYTQHQGQQNTVYQYLLTARGHADAAAIFATSDTVRAAADAVRAFGVGPRALGYIEAAQAHLGGQLRLFTSDGATGRTIHLPDVYCAGMQMSWAQTHTQFGHQAGTVRSQLQAALGHSRNSDAFDGPDAIIGRALAALDASGVGPYTAERVGEALMRLKDQLAGRSCDVILD